MQIAKQEPDPSGLLDFSLVASAPNAMTLRLDGKIAPPRVRGAEPGHGREVDQLRGRERIMKVS